MCLSPNCRTLKSQGGLRNWPQQEQSKVTDLEVGLMVKGTPVPLAELTQMVQKHIWLDLYIHWKLSTVSSTKVIWIQQDSPNLL